MHKIIKIKFLILFSIINVFAYSQAHKDFEVTKIIDATSIKNQGQTGSCWSFATLSFFEAEALRKGFEKPNFSEMYIVRNMYIHKITGNLKNSDVVELSEGGLAHDVLFANQNYGLVPESAYNGHPDGNYLYNHEEMLTMLNGMLTAYKNKYGTKIKAKCLQSVDAILDIYIGETPRHILIDGLIYNPMSYLHETGINTKDYMEFTSFSHEEFYKTMHLAIPDNWMNYNQFYNVPMDEMMEIINNALENGYTIAWDGDVSEKGFDNFEATAQLQDENQNTINEITQQFRQEEFEAKRTTDDHLMHIIGTAKHNDGRRFYVIKNSWGESSNLYGGYLFMSEAYVTLKTVSFLVHKDAVPKKIMKKFE